MEMPADFGGQRHGVDLADRIALHTRRLRSLEGFLNRVVELKGVPANNTCAKIMGFYGLLQAIRMEELDVGPRFELVSIVFDAGLQSLKCVLLAYVVLSNMPWSVALLCILMAVLFIAK